MIINFITRASLLVAFFLLGSNASLAQGWETYKVEGATVTFEMPQPIKMQQDPKTGTIMYVSKKGKISMKVAIQKRNYQQDVAKGNTDDKVLDNFALRFLALSKRNFEKMGFPTKFQFSNNIKTSTGIGKQFNAKVGKAFVLNRFYVNKQGLYMVEAITQNTKDPDINRFLKSFKP